MLPHSCAYESSHHKVLRRTCEDGPFPRDMEYLEFLKKFVDPNKSKTDFEKDVEVAVLVYEDALSIHNKRTTRATRTRRLLFCDFAEGIAVAVRNFHKNQIGWDVLNDFELLEYSFEQIILDYPEEFEHLDDFNELKYICKSRLQNN
jgi:hypothetical protein